MTNKERQSIRIRVPGGGFFIDFATLGSALAWFDGHINSPGGNDVTCAFFYLEYAGTRNGCSYLGSWFWDGGYAWTDAGNQMRDAERGPK